jgi:osmotically-inducible protein OsmY
MMRTNAELYDDVMAKLKMTPNLMHEDITVAIDGGIVTVAGTVKYLVEKLVAERVIKSIVGVKGIANELEVNLPASLQRSDTDLAKSAVQALEWDLEVPDNTIQVAVEHGHVKLTGQVKSWFQRRAAEKAINRLKGVKGLLNKVTIKPNVTKEDIKKQICREFHRHSQIDADKITVEVDNGIVTLTGKVETFAEKREAEHAAWSIAGVTQVDNQLHLF